jgi:hypothetical protein
VELPSPDRVQSFEDFIGFVEALSEHFVAEHQGEDWQNWNVGAYLEVIAAWLRAEKPLMGHELGEIEAERPSWRGVAMILDAGRFYE